jgi:hypothetical protein
MKYLILIALCASAFALVISGREKPAIKILVFTIPFYAAPFHDFNVLIGMNGFLILTIWAGLRLRESPKFRLKTWRRISRWLSVLYYFLFMGIVLGLLHGDYSFSPNNIPPLLQIVNFSCYIILVILFIKIMANYVYDFEFQTEMLFVFVATSFLQLFSIGVSVSGYAHLFPRFLVGEPTVFLDPTINQFTQRFAGLLGDYELIADYALMVMGFSIVLWAYGRNKIVLLSAIISALIIGVASGTRSFIVILVIFMVMVVFVRSYVAGSFAKSAKVITGMSAAVVVLGVVAYQLLQNSLIAERLKVAIYLFQMTDNLQQASNRNLLSDVPIILKQAGILGNGSLSLDVINGNMMVSHNVFLAVFAKFGLAGLVAAVLLFFNSFVKLLKVIRGKIYRHLDRSVAGIFFSLLGALFFEEMKISAVRYLSSMLMYSFFFLNIWFCAYRAKHPPLPVPARGAQWKKPPETSKGK